VNGNANPETLKLIRVALTAGVLAVGVAAFFITGRPDHEPSTAEFQNTMRIAFSGLAIGALAGVGVFRGMIARAEDLQRKLALVISSWALGEGVALFGGVHYLLSGDPLLYIVGVVILFAAFLLVPVPEPA
jgi:hypothetical protein